ncbi:hypothetical protein LIER_09850 [Lithospermum erythrorhizon]|uniref:Uncharacterized protein n=1 Tax=Lithospermum erythrorhizon TaxID=34254 RepID=A0AAV3PM44_LITER
MIGIFGALDSYDINIPFSDPSMRLVEFIDRVSWIPIIPSGNCDYYSVNGNCNGLLWIPENRKIVCRWGERIRVERYKTHICAFDMVTEKVSALLLPAKVASNVFQGDMVVLGENLCLWEFSRCDAYMYIW